MKKLIMIVAMALTVTLGAFFMGAAKAAEEPMTELAPSVSVSAEPDSTTGANSELKPEKDETDFFNETILPLLISAGSVLLLVIGFIAPYIKKSNAYKALNTAYKAVKVQLKNQEEILNNLDTETLKKAIAESVGAGMADLFAKFEEAIKKELQFDNKALAEIYGGQELIKAMVGKFMEAARIVWAEADGAVTVLSEAPTQASVQKLALENKLLQEQIRGLASASADEIIAGVTVEVEKAVSGNNGQITEENAGAGKAVNGNDELSQG